MLTGSTGQLGQALLSSRPSHIAGRPLELLITVRPSVKKSDPGLKTIPLNLADPAACHAAVLEHRPDWVINAGAYTAVDQAELEPELAMLVNASGPRALAKALSEMGHGQLLQLSTDFVFSGQQGHPYTTQQSIQPLGSYGLSKAAGEQAVIDVLGPRRAVVLRTSWVYGPVGRNFLLTMLALHRKRASDGQALTVVADQVGCPTSTAGLALACWQVLHRSGDYDLPSVLHWSDAGACSWYDFAQAIGELAIAEGVLQDSAQLVPIRTIDYPTPAKRPSYSLLDCADSRQALELDPLHWRLALKNVLIELARSRKSSRYN